MNRMLQASALLPVTCQSALAGCGPGPLACLGSDFTFINCHPRCGPRSNAMALRAQGLSGWTEYSYRIRARGTDNAFQVTTRGN